MTDEADEPTRSAWNLLDFRSNRITIRVGCSGLDLQRFEAATPNASEAAIDTVDTAITIA